MAAVGEGTQAVLAPARGWAILLQHRRHQVRHGPHALADLRLAWQAALQADVDVLALIRLQPLGVLQISLRQHRPGFHRGMDLIASAVEEAGIDEYHASARGADAFHEIYTGAALLVHDAHLDGVARQRQQVLDLIKQLVGERHLVGPVHLGLDDIDRAAARVANRTFGLKIMQCDQRGDDRIDERLGHCPATPCDRLTHHVMADIAHQHQAAAGQYQLLPIGRAIATIGIETAMHQLASLVEAGLQRAIHQAQPVAIDVNLVVCVHRCYRIFAILNGGYCRLEHEVGNACWVIAAQGMTSVYLDLDMQLVMHQQQRCGCDGSPRKPTKAAPSCRLVRRPSTSITDNPSAQAE